MRKFIIVLLVLVLIIGFFVFDLMKDAGQFRKIEPYFAGQIQRIAGVVGAEDITIHPKTGVAFISCDDRRAVLRLEESQGAIYAYDLKSADPQLILLTQDFDEEFHPHGISFYLGQNDAARIFVVNHRQNGHFIEIFDVGDSTLIHLESIRDPLMHSPNDVVAVGPRSFYVTNDHGNRSGLGRTLEEYLRLPRSNVLYSDGAHFRKVAEGLAYANGINKSLDGATIYVATTTAGKIYVYDRDLTSGTLTEVTQIDLGTGVDNIEVDPFGNLWVGAHPQLLTFVEYAKDASKLSPSQGLKIGKLDDGGYEVKEIFLDDGRKLSGSSVAAVYEKKLLIGSVFDAHFLVCDMNPITAN